MKKIDSGGLVMALEKAVHIGGDPWDQGGERLVVPELDCVLGANNRDEVHVDLPHPPEGDHIEVTHRHGVTVTGNRGVINSGASGGEMLTCVTN